MIINWITADSTGAGPVSVFGRRVAPMLAERATVNEWIATPAGWSTSTALSGAAPTFAPALSWPDLNRASMSVFVLQRGGGPESARVAGAARMHPGLVVLPDFASADLLEWAAQSAPPHRAHQLYDQLAAEGDRGRDSVRRQLSADDGDTGRRATDPRAVVVRSALAVVVHDEGTADMLRFETDAKVICFSPIDDNSPDADVERYADRLTRVAGRFAGRHHCALMPQLMARSGRAFASLSVCDAPMMRVAEAITFLASSRRAHALAGDERGAITAPAPSRSSR